MLSFARRAVDAVLHVVLAAFVTLDARVRHFGLRRRHAWLTVAATATLVLAFAVPAMAATPQKYLWVLPNNYLW